MIDAVLISKVVVKLATSRIFWYAIILSSLYGYYKWTNYTISYLRDENRHQAQEIYNLQESIKDTVKTYDGIIKDIKELNDEHNKNLTEIEKLRNVLFRENRNKKSLESLATKKSSLIERRINNATKNILGCIENLSENRECTNE
jgi:virulence-associated protein VapD